MALIKTDFIFKLKRLKMSQNNEDIECAICFEPSEDCIKTPCNHYFHENCLDDHLYENALCPTCNFKLYEGEEYIPELYLKNQFNSEIPDDYFLDYPDLKKLDLQFYKKKKKKKKWKFPPQLVIQIIS